MITKEPTFNEKGLVKCEICGQFFHRVICHTLKAHGMNAVEYKLKFGFALSNGLCSDKSRLKTRNQLIERLKNGHLDKFFTSGLKTQYKSGTSGRNIKKQVNCSI